MDVIDSPWEEPFKEKDRLFFPEKKNINKLKHKKQTNY